MLPPPGTPREPAAGGKRTPFAPVADPSGSSGRKQTPGLLQESPYHLSLDECPFHLSLDESDTSVLTTSGDNSVLTTGGDNSVLTTSGDNSVLTTSGDTSVASECALGEYELDILIPLIFIVYQGGGGEGFP